MSESDSVLSLTKVTLCVYYDQFLYIFLLLNLNIPTETYFSEGLYRLLVKGHTFDKENKIITLLYQKFIKIEIKWTVKKYENACQG